MSGPIGAVDAVSGEPFAVEGDSADGSIRVDVRTMPAGSLVVTGNNTPADNYPNPTDALDTQAFLSGWDGAAWDRLRALFTDDGISPTSALSTSAFGLALSTVTGLWTRHRSKPWGTTPGADVASSGLGNLCTIGEIVGPDGAGAYRTARVTSAGALAFAGVVTDGPAGYSLATYQVPCLTTRGGLLATYRRPPTASGNDQWSLARAQNVNAASMIGAACCIFSMRVANDTGSVARVALVNKASAPVNGDTILAGPYVVANGATLTLTDRDLGPAGMYCTLGCAVALVTTVGAATVTLAGAPTGLLVEVQGNT